MFLIYVLLGVSFLIGVIVLRRSRTRGLMPLHAALEIALTCAAIESGGVAQKILYFLRRSRAPFFGIFGNHQVVHNLASTDRFLCQPAHTLDNLPTLWNTHVRCFGGDTSKDTRDKFFALNRDLLAAVDHVFLSEARSSDAVQHGDIAGKVSRLVSFSGGKAGLEPWERHADPVLIGPNVVELDLMRAVRDLTAHVGLEVIYGKDFLDRNPDFIQDMWDFVDGAFVPLLAGLPRWLPLKPISHGVAACERIRGVLAAYYKRIDQYQSGKPVDFAADVSDASGTVFERNAIYKKHNFSLRQRADLDMGVAFGSSTNTPVLTFWFIVFLTTRPELLAEVRAELSPHVTVRHNEATGRHEIASIDHPALYQECPLFKSALFETARLTGGSIPIRYCHRPTPATTAQGTSHVLHPGTWVSVPSGLSQKDPSVYPNPEEFIAGRFIEAEDGNGRKVARAGQLRVFGSGAGVCKGKTYALKEALGIAAAVVSLWDLESAEGGVAEPPPKDPVRKMPSQGWRVRVKRRSSFGV